MKYSITVIKTKDSKIQIKWEVTGFPNNFIHKTKIYHDEIKKYDIHEATNSLSEGLYNDGPAITRKTGAKRNINLTYTTLNEEKATHQAEALNMLMKEIHKTTP